MSQQTIFFMEHHKVDLFGLNKDKSHYERLNISKNIKVKLVATSSLYGFIVVGYKNAVKILSISQFDTKTSDPINESECVATINLPSNQHVLQVCLNVSETCLIVLTGRGDENAQAALEYSIQLYDLETISFKNPKQTQSPICSNTINLDKDNSDVLELFPSPADPDMLALCKSNGSISIISKIFDKSPRILSKQENAFCICWSPKGKNLAVCSKNKRLFLFNLELELKHSYECLLDNLIPTNVHWTTKKQFFVSYEDDQAQPVVYYHEITTDKATQTDSFKTYEYPGLVYSMETNDTPFVSSCSMNLVNDWNIMVVEYSKCPDIFLMEKQPNSEAFEIIDIEDFRCTLPVTPDNDEQFPIGFAINYNCKNNIEFSTYGTQPASPLIFLLTDTGFLASYFLINTNMKNKSICYDAKQMNFKQVQQQAPPAQFGFQSQAPPAQNNQISQSKSIQFNAQPSFGAPANVPGSTSLFNFNSAPQPAQNQSGLSLFKPQPAVSNAPIPSLLNNNQSTPNKNQFSFNTGLKPSFQTPQPATPQPTSQPSVSQPLNFMTQNQPPVLNQPQTTKPPVQPLQSLIQKPEEPKPIQPVAQITQIAKEPVQRVDKPPQIPTQVPTQILNQSNIQSLDDSIHKVDINKKIRDFSAELDDFKANIEKLFKGKDLSKHFLNLSVIRDTKIAEEEFSKLNTDMKAIEEESINLRTNLLAAFNKLERLRIMKSNLETRNPSITVANQYEIDPLTKTRFDEIKKLYEYVWLKLPSIKNQMEMQRTRIYEQSKNALHSEGVFEGIQMIDMRINLVNRKINKIIDQIKQTKDGRYLLHDYNLLFSKPIADRNVLLDRTNKPDLSLNKSLSSEVQQNKYSDLEKDLSRLKLETSISRDDDSSEKQKVYRNPKVIKQFYDILKKRKQVPTQQLNLNRLDLFDSKFDDAKQTKLVLTDTSFLNLKTQASPNVSQIARPAFGTPVQIQPPVFQQNQQFSQIDQQIPKQLAAPVVQQPAPSLFNQKQIINQAPDQGRILNNQQPQLQQQTQQPVQKPPQFQSQPQSVKLPVQQSQIAQPPQQPQASLAENPQQKPSQIPSINIKPIAQPVSQQAGLNFPNIAVTSTPTNQASFSFNLSTSSPLGNQTSSNIAPKSLFPSASGFSLDKPAAQPASLIKQSESEPAIAKSSSSNSLSESLKQTENKTQPATETPKLPVQQSQITQQPNRDDKPIFSVNGQQPVQTQNKPAQSLFQSSGSAFSFGSKPNDQGTAQQPAFSAIQFGQKAQEQKSTTETKSEQKPQTPVESKSPAVPQSSNPISTSVQTKPAETSTQPAQVSKDTTTVKPEAPAAGLTTLLNKPAASGSSIFGSLNTTSGSNGFSFGLPSASNQGKLSFGTSAAPVTNTPKQPESAEKSENNIPSNTENQPPKPQEPPQASIQTPSVPPPTPVTPSAPVTTPATPAVSSSSSSTPAITALLTNQPASSSTPAEQPTPTPIIPATAVSSIPAPVAPQPTSSTPAFPSSTPAITPTPTQSLQTAPLAPSNTLNAPTSTNTAPSLFGSTQPSQANSFFNIANNKPAGGNMFSNFLNPGNASPAPAVNPFTAVIQKAQQGAPNNENEADMDSANSLNLAGGLSFGSGFGSQPTTADPNKNVFGSGPTFGSIASQPAPTQPKSPFGGILKNPTFTTSTASTAPSTGLFGSSTASTTPSGGLFGSSTSASTDTQSSGGLFSSFKTPQKPTFGGAPAFGGSPAFGAAPTFGSPAFGATSAPAVGGFGAAPVFGGGATFDSAAANKPLFGSTTPNQTTGFGSVSTTGFGALASSGTTFGGFGQAASNAPTFGALAQQQPQQSLFSSFSNNPRLVLDSLVQAPRLPLTGNET